MFSLLEENVVNTWKMKKDIHFLKSKKRQVMRHSRLNYVIISGRCTTCHVRFETQYRQLRTMHSLLNRRIITEVRELRQHVTVAQTNVVV